MPKATCAMCGAAFQRRRKNGRPPKFCTQACSAAKQAIDRESAQRRYAETKNTRTCVDCGIAFIRLGNAGPRDRCLSCVPITERPCVICMTTFESRPGGNASCYCQTCAKAVARHHRYGDPKPVAIPRPCPTCLAMFVPTGKAGRYCSVVCRKPNRQTECALAPCEECGKPCRPYMQRNMRTLCVPCRVVWRTTARARSGCRSRRWAAETIGDRGINWTSLGERDGWMCHLCGKSVKRLAGTAYVPQGATVDHLIPISAGGSHTWDNVSLAHRSCNISRGAKGVAQLRLVG
jgi:5-methylcytosine-specific restriction endonuclease McrA